LFGGPKALGNEEKEEDPMALGEPSMASFWPVPETIHPGATRKDLFHV